MHIHKYMCVHACTCVITCGGRLKVPNCISKRPTKLYKNILKLKNDTFIKEEKYR